MVTNGDVAFAFRIVLYPCEIFVGTSHLPPYFQVIHFTTTCLQRMCQVMEGAQGQSIIKE